MDDNEDVETSGRVCKYKSMEKSVNKSGPLKTRIVTAPKFTHQDVRRLREAYKVSQRVFAHHLGASPSTVSKWESGKNRPSVAASRLLLLVEKHGLQILV